MQINSHMSVLIHDLAKQYGDREMLVYQDFGGKEWKSLSWNQVSQTVKKVSNALLNMGVKVQENIGIFSQNSVQYLCCDFGAWGVRAVTIPFYATSSEQPSFFVEPTRAPYGTNVIRKRSSCTMYRSTTLRVASSEPSSTTITSYIG